MTVSVVPNICLIITAPAKKVKHILKQIYCICIAEFTSFNHGKFDTAVFYINKVMREEVELFE